jgi:hypothetical protein
MGLAPGGKRSDGWFYLCRDEGDSHPITRAVITNPSFVTERESKIKDKTPKAFETNGYST